MAAGASMKVDRAASPMMAAFAAALMSITAATVPAWAGSICRDGSWTASEGRGTCSHHGGVAQKGVDAPQALPSPVAPPSPFAPPSPLPTPSPLTPGTAPTPSGLPVPAGVVLPLPLTPGAVDTRVTQATVATTICRRGYTATVRPSSSYTTSLKRRQLATDYAFLGSRQLSAFEEDHLIPLELGGSPTSPENLWPQPYAGSGARLKDRVENRLHAMVCAGAIPLATAQRAIADNWYTAYLDYVAS